MRNVWIGLSLFVVQLVLTFKGSAWLGKYLNPVVLFSISMALPVLFLRQRLDTGSNPPVSKPSGYRPWIGAGLGLLAMLLCYEELRKLFVQFAVPRDYSDVIPQLEMLYIRFRDGIFPYAPVDMGSYQPYPVYMPMHWLPVFFADKFHVDSRWIGYGILALAHAGFGFALARKHTISVRTIIAILLPSLALWAFILWGTLDIPISYELVIAAYYLVLAFGLYTRNTVVIALGLVLCLLSRYTLVFWIPLFAVLLWWNKPWKTSVAVWGAAAAAFILLYLLPFYAKDPSILTKGVTYHNNAAIDEWKGYGDPPVSWTFERGITFAPHLKALFKSGEMAQRVTGARAVQGGLMLLLCFGGLFLYYRKWRTRLDWYDFSLAMLYIIIACFYFFGPLTYRYYLIVLFMLSAMLTAGIVVYRKPAS